MRKYFFTKIALPLFFGLSLPLFARSAQELVRSGHWVYDSLTAVSLDAGVLNFSGTAPVTIKQIQLYLDEIDYDALSEVGKSEFDRIQRYFSEEPFKAVDTDIVSLGLEPSLNLSGFYKSEDEIDWVFDRYARRPLIYMPVTIAAGDYAAMSMDVLLGQNKGTSLHNDNYSDIITSADQIDNAFPDTGYFSAAYMLTERTGIGFQLGRGSRSVGRTLTGSMIWSDYLTGVSYGQLELFSPGFKYTGAVSQFNVDKYMYHHQIDARFFNKKLQVSFIEGLLVNAPMELRYLNPWMIFHGFAAWREYEPDDDDPESHTCDYFGVSLQFTPVRYTRFYGTFAMTQYQTPYEKSNWSDSPTPDGLGAQVGNETYVPVGRGRFHLAFEGSWANPYLYIKESPNWSMVRTYSENMGDKAIFYEWLGSPFGPDTLSAEVTVGYEVPERWSLDFVYLFMARGENSGTNVFDRLYKATGWGGQKTYFDYSVSYDKNGEKILNPYLANWAYPDKDYQSNWKALRDLVAPSGTVEYVNRLSLKGSWQPKSWLSFSAQPSYVVIFNRHNEPKNTVRGFEVACAISVNFIKF